MFNIAHGAVGMLMAFLYWQVRFDWGWPAPLSLAFVLLVAAPLLGAAIERTLARNLAKASLVSSLVVTIGLLLVLMGVALNVWPPEGRRVDGFFAPGGFDLGPVFVTWHQTITVLVAVAVAVGLRLLMFRTRAGVTMRAVVDHRALAALIGAPPVALVSTLSWALGSSLGRPGRHPARARAAAERAGAHAARRQRLRRGHGRPAAQRPARPSSAPWCSA